MYRLVRLFSSISLCIVKITNDFDMKKRKDNKNKNAVMILNSEIDDYKIVRVYKKSCKHLLSYLKKNEKITRVYIQENELTLEQIQELLILKKHIALINTLPTKSIIFVEN